MNVLDTSFNILITLSSFPSFSILLNQNLCIDMWQWIHYFTLEFNGQSSELIARVEPNPNREKIEKLWLLFSDLKKYSNNEDVNADTLVLFLGKEQVALQAKRLKSTVIGTSFSMELC